MSALWTSWQLYSPYLLQGAWLTVRLSVVAMLVALVLGIFGALARLSTAIPARVLATAYVEIFRGTPILIQLYVANFVVVGWLNDNNINPDTFWVGALTLGINYGAYLTEVYRAGILTIDHGQREAALSLGMREARLFRRVILPQAVRVVIPPLANNFITLIQDSSYLSAISLVELTNAGEALASGNSVETRWHIYGIAGVLYFALCYPVALLARHAERRLRKHLL